MANENILVVDDDPAWRNTLELILKGEGYRVLLTKDFSTALDKIIRSGAWFVMADLAVCVVDLRFSGSPIEESYDGLGLLAVCQGQGIPTIVVSGFLTPALKNQLRDQFQVTACFDKSPFTEQEFLAAVREALAPHRRVRVRLKEMNDLEFQTKLQNLVDTVIDYYIRANSMINDRQRERRIARGQPSTEDEALWEQQIHDLDNRYSTIVNKLSQINTIEELNRIHAEIIKECLKWVTGSTL
jgi:DNA-binding NtrC family response regulator